MANREQRGNKEARKPKKEKAAKGAPMPMSSGAGAKPAATTVAWKQKPPK
ncbi:MAG TPA: hypothetical protein VFB16_03635 [Bauldia sp.]|nr:hypothetical protein [Bauldia sp.]